MDQAFASVRASYPTLPARIARNAWAFAASTKAGTKLSETERVVDDVNPLNQAESS
jgi:hypothetical protein